MGCCCGQAGFWVVLKRMADGLCGEVVVGYNRQSCMEMDRVGVYQQAEYAANRLLVTINCHIIRINTFKSSQLRVKCQDFLCKTVS